MCSSRNPHAETVTVTWVLTEDGNDTTTTDELQITPGELTGAADLLRAAFFNEA